MVEVGDVYDTWRMHDWGPTDEYRSETGRENEPGLARSAVRGRIGGASDFRRQKQYRSKNGTRSARAVRGSHGNVAAIFAAG